MALPDTPAGAAVEGGAEVSNREGGEASVLPKTSGAEAAVGSGGEGAAPEAMDTGDEPMSTAVGSETATVEATGAPVMVVPEVDTSLRAELESMGFSTARSIRALHFTGSSGVEAAVNWIVEHEEDPDIDTELLISKEEADKPKLTPEEAKARAAELLEKARRRKEEEERRLEKEREAERIRAGKELLLAQRKLEDEERKRRLDERKREKEEEKRAKERILQRLEEDKRERRRKLGLPEVEPPKEQEAAAEVVTATTSASPGPQKGLAVRPASKAEKLRTVLRSMKQNHKDDGAKVTRAFETLMKYVSNLGQNPGQEKFRKIRLTNAAFQERVGCYPESIEFLELCGFEKEGDSGEFLVVPAEKLDVSVLRAAAGELDSAINNPYFGVL